MIPTLRRLATPFAVASILSTAGAAVAAPVKPIPVTAPDAEALAVSMRDALSSGEWNRVTPLFHAKNDPILAYLKERWLEMMRGTLDPVAWEVTFDPYEATPQRASGQLAIAARRADGSRVGRRFDVQLVRRGSRWLIGEALAYHRQETLISRHDLVVDLTAEGATLVAEDTMTLEPQGPDRRMFLRLSPALVVSEAKAGAQPLRFRQIKDMLFLERPAGPGPHQVTVRYTGALPEGRWDYITRTGSVLRSEFPWYPRLPFGSPFAVFNLKARVRPGHQVVAVGDLDGVDRFADGFVYSWTTTRPVEGMTLYAVPFAPVAGAESPVRLEAFVPEVRQAAAPQLLAEAGRVLDYYGKAFGPYPYRKLALVETEFPGGYGATTAVSLPAEAFARPEVADELLAHEIAHNWTDLVAYKGTMGERGFMAEGMASYMDMLYHGERDGVAAFREALMAAQDRYRSLLDSEADVALKEASQDGDRRLWQTLTYDKGAIVLHMLREQIGAEAFHKGVTTLYTEHRGREIGLEDFRKAFELPARTNLHAFFDQWVNRPGVASVMPEALKVQAVAGGRYQITGLMRQRTRAYAFDVPVVVVSDKKQALYRIPVRSHQTAFKLMVEGRPRFFLVDPLGDALLTSVPPVRFQ